jgi:4-amino-4-deoxy-L-arabinose transferase-like glycosyltransferase
MRIIVGRGYLLPVVVALALAMCDVLLLLQLPNALQSWAALVLAVVLPGQLLVARLFARGRLDVGEHFVYGVAAGITLFVLTLLALSYLPGGLSFAHVLVAFNVLTLLLLAMNPAVWRVSSLASSLTLRFPRWDLTFAALLALMIGAAFLRFTHLGYSELHGDEALVALRATDVIQGWERALFVHKKGPGEILIATGFYLLTGELTEYAAHLPFAVASWTGVLAVYLLGVRWFGPIAGWWAGAMVMVDGYLMAFGRMLQYQSIVFLMVVAAVLAVQMARQNKRVIVRHLLLAALFLASGLLAHYEAIIAVVPATALLLGIWQRQGSNWAAARRLVGWLAWPLLLGIAVCAAFYVPFVLDPEFFRDTFAYIFGHRLAGQASPEVFPTVVGRSTLYSSSYYFWTLVVLTVGGMFHGYVHYTRLWARVLLSMLLAGAMVALLTDATNFLSENNWLARGMFVATFIPFWGSRIISAQAKAVWLWFGLPLMAVMFFIAKPGTHVYIFFIPWALVTGMVLQELWSYLARWWGRRRARAVLAPLVALLVVIFGSYVYQLFVRNDPEILLTWDENRPPGYVTTFETPAFESIFGFPIRNGWKSVASLYAQGVLRGRFDTNDRFSMVPDWYVRGAEYCGRDEMNYYLLVPYPLPVDRPLMEQKRQELADRFYLWGVVTSNDHPHMEIYARRDRVAAEQAGAPRTLREEDFVEFYNENLLAPFTRNGPLGAQPIPNPSAFRYGDHIQLVGHSVGSVEAARGGEVELHLYWTTDAPISENYYVSVQLINLQTTAKAGQRDGEPGCNRFQTSTWVPGDVIFDRYFVPVEEEVEPGDYALFVKMYNEQGTLMVTEMATGAVSDGAILTTITVR